MKIKVLLGGNSAEREVSIHTGLAVIEAIQDYHDVESVYIDSDISALPSKLFDADIVFNALHGGIGENGDLQAFLDLYHIPYIGSGAKASKLAMDKHLTKTISNSINVPTPTWINLTKNKNGKIRLDKKLAKKINYPCVVKPSDGGSSVGMTIVKMAEDIEKAIAFAADYSDDIMIEAFIPGREITVGIIDGKVLPIVEIVPTHTYYDYECKYTQGMSKYVCPAKISPTLTKKIQKDAVKIYEQLGCRHYARVDFRLDDKNQHYLLEANTLPGLTSTSLLPKAAKEVGLSYPNLVETLIKIGLNEK